MEAPKDQETVDLVAVLDWHSRYVVAWRLSNTLKPVSAPRRWKRPWERAGRRCSKPARAAQFTSPEFTQALQEQGVKISMDGKGRYHDNIFVERLWRTVKYEEVYLNACASLLVAKRDWKTTFGSTTRSGVFHGEQGVADGESYGRRRSPGEVIESPAG